MSTHANRVKMTVTSVASSGTGDITLNAASTGFRSFATAYGANATVDILITEGSTWEIARNCTYTHSGTTVSRGTLENSSTGSAVVFTSAAVVSVIATASFGNAAETVLGSFGALDGENSITGTATAVIGRLNVCSGTSANYTVTLPAVSGNSGKYIGFCMAPGLTKLVTLDGNSTETIDGSLTRVMWAKETALLYCDGSTWTKMAGKTVPLTCTIYRDNTAQNIANSSEEIVLLNTLITDNSGAMAVLASNRIDVVRTGTYQIIGTVSYDTFGAVSANTQCRLHVNGTLVRNVTVHIPSGGLGAMSASHIFDAALSDAVTLRTYQTSGGSEGLFVLGLENKLTVQEIPSW